MEEMAKRRTAETPRLPLCREPWESYYILRRGILPCCYGGRPIAPMSEWKTAWNSPQAQEIRRYLSRGRLSPYCLESLGCPIVQRCLQTQGGKSTLFTRFPLFKWLNRLMFRIPGRIFGRLEKRRAMRRYS